jgi:hypothetical protein
MILNSPGSGAPISFRPAQLELGGAEPHPGRERYWLRAQPPFRFRWLRVVVQFEGDVDHVVTAFGQDNDPEGLPT